jgi:hypothetical protein
VAFDETAPCSHDVFECAGDNEMDESIFVDEGLQDIDGVEDKPLLLSTSSPEPVGASTLEAEAPQATTSSTIAVEASRVEGEIISEQGAPSHIQKVHRPQQIIGNMNKRVTHSSRSAHLSCFTNTLFVALFEPQDVGHALSDSSCDGDITNMDTPIVAYDSKVKLSFSIIMFNTCDEWMLHHVMCSMSFKEVLTWIKEGVDHAWKGWIMKHLDWGPNTCAPYTSTRLIQIPGIVRTKIVTEITYGLRFGRSLYGWKDKRITFPMDLVSRPNTFLLHGKRRTHEAYRTVRVLSCHILA